MPPLVARGTPADRVGAAGLTGATRNVLPTVMGRPCGRALLLFNAVVVHDVRCRKLPVLLFRGPRVTFFFKLFGRRIGPGGWYLTYPGGDKPDLFFGSAIFITMGWFLVAGWYLRKVRYLTSNTALHIMGGLDRERADDGTF